MYKHFLKAAEDFMLLGLFSLFLSLDIYASEALIWGQGSWDKAEWAKDQDGDLIPDRSDVFPVDANESVDTDSDGVGNNADADDDNDGVVDIDDLFPLDASESSDRDGDGRR